MAFNINEIKSQLALGGARPSLFQVRLTNPATSEADSVVPFMVKAAQIPASTIAPIEVFYFGRPIKLAGQRVFDNWTVTVINDEDFKVRKALETWSYNINSYSGNIREFATSAPAEYKGRAEVIQYSKVGEELRTYVFEGIFPIALGPIELSWENGNAIEEFQCEFALDYWTVPADGQE